MTSHDRGPPGRRPPHSNPLKDLGRLTAATLLLVTPLTAQALPPRYSVRKGFGRYLAMLVL
jgi:hypothetical protein